jgi:hypothetical protein
VADIILLFSDIVPETVVKLLIVKLFVVVFTDIKLFAVANIVAGSTFKLYGIEAGSN